MRRLGPPFKGGPRRRTGRRAHPHSTIRNCPARSPCRKRPAVTPSTLHLDLPAVAAGLECFELLLAERHALADAARRCLVLYQPGRLRVGLLHHEAVALEGAAPFGRAC